MRTPAAYLPTLSRRDFLRALGSACIVRFRPVLAWWTAVPDDFDWLMRWCSRGAEPSFAAG